MVDPFGMNLQERFRKDRPLAGIGNYVAYIPL